MNLCSHSNCQRCSLRSTCGGCSFCEVPLCGQDCQSCVHLCPAKAKVFPLAKSLNCETLSLKTNKLLHLPAMIPVIPDRLTEPMTMDSVLGIHGGKMLTSNGENIARVYQQRGLAGALNLNNHVTGVFQLYTQDRKLEGFWENRKAIYQQLKAFDWKAVISPNFSVYDDVPRIEHLYNIKRSTIVYNELVDEGLPAVPDVSWYNKADLDRWATAINRGGVQTIAFSFQSVHEKFRPSKLYIHQLTGLKYLTEHISPAIRIIVAGIATPRRVTFFMENIQNPMSFLNQAAYVQSRRGILSENGKKAPETLSKNQILTRNIDYYKNAYRR